MQNAHRMTKKSAMNSQYRAPSWALFSFVLLKLIEAKMANIIMRSAQDDFYALLTAQGMENAGANVFSISNRNMDASDSSLIPLKFIVWAKHNNSLTVEKIDEFIDAEIEAAFKK